MFSIANVPCGCGGRLMFEQKCCRCGANSFRGYEKKISLPIKKMTWCSHSIFNRYPSKQCNNAMMVNCTDFSYGWAKGSSLYFCPKCKAMKYLQREPSYTTRTTLKVSNFILNLLLE